MSRAWREELAGLLSDVRFDEPLSSHTTFRIGGPADAFAQPKNRGELALLARFARERGVPVLLFGRGSKVLVREGGVRGIVVRLGGEFARVEFPGGAFVEAGAAAWLPELVALCARRGLAGLEPLAGIPASFGGALVMNAGTREAQLGSFVREVEVFEEAQGSSRRLPAAQLRFGYRESSLAGRWVLGGRLELSPGDKDVIILRVRELQARRSRTQPLNTFNVGSIFKNPPGRFAAQLIEQSGLKGLRAGGARISPLHANFFENENGASAADVLALVETAQRAVLERFGVALELEMRVIGEELPGPAQA